MAQREILLPWDSQPQESAQPIDFGAPAFLFNAATGAFDSVTGDALTLGPSTTFRPTSQGVALKVSRVTSAGLSYGSMRPLQGDAWTIMVLANPSSGDGQSTLFSQREGSSPFIQVDFLANSTRALAASAGRVSAVLLDVSPGNRDIESTSTSLVDGNFHLFGLTRPGVNTFPSLYVDGVFQGVTQTGTGTGTSIKSTQEAKIGNIGSYTAANTYAASCDFPFVLVVNRAFSPEEMLSYAKFIWGSVYAPRTIWVPVSAGGGGSTLLPSGISSLEAFGTASISVGTVTVAVSSIASSEAFGTHVISNGSLILVPTGISSAEAFGAASLQAGTIIVTPSGIASAEAFGTGTVLVGELVIYPNGISSAELFGIPTLTGGTPSTATSVFYVRGFSSFGFRRNN